MSAGQWHRFSTIKHPKNTPCWPPEGFSLVPSKPISEAIRKRNTDSQKAPPGLPTHNQRQHHAGHLRRFPKFKSRMTAASTSPHEEITMAIQSTISQIQSAATTAQQATATKNDPSQLGESDFLKLLTTQLQQQDPTQPMDNTAMVAQLAQFSALEQMTNVNTTLTQMLTGQGTALEATAASMVGKTAIFNTDQVSLTQGKTATITANLSQAARKL